MSWTEEALEENIEQKAGLPGKLQAYEKALKVVEDAASGTEVDELGEFIQNMIVNS